jgi:hypothetical protein
MSDSDKRFAKALTYLSNLSAELGHDVTTKTAQWTADQKDLISLSGSSAWRTGSDEQHIAVRALLLCTMVYFRPPHAAMQLVDDAALKLIRDKMLGKTRAFIDDEIRLYVRAPAPSKDDLAAAAERVCYPIGTVTGYLRTREDTNLGNGPVCYNGTSTWLFAAGFVSRRWLAKEGSQMLDKTARGFLGEGALVGGRDQWGNIPRGHIFHIHKTGDQNTCHWGVSLGSGRAAACNNTAQAPERNGDGSKVRMPSTTTGKLGVPRESNLSFEGSGNPTYGVFRMAELCDILDRTSKYMVGTLDKNDPSADWVESNHPSGCNIVVRHVDPERQVIWY